MAAGFWQYGQEELLQPWAERYFAALPGIWASRGPALALQITQLLYPQLDEPETLTLTDGFLAAAEMTGRLPPRRPRTPRRDRPSPPSHGRLLTPTPRPLGAYGVHGRRSRCRTREEVRGGLVPGEHQ